MESPRRRNGPPQFLTGLALLCVLLFALLLLIRQIDPQEREARQTLAYRQAQLEATLEPIDLFAAAIWRLLPPALIIAAGATGLAIAWRRWGWRESIAAGYTIEAIRADRQQLPTSLHTLNYHSAPRYSGAPALIGKAEPEPEPVEADAPSMTELLREGRVGRGNPLMLGYEQGREITGSWLDLYATITAGLPGTGKTTTQRFFAAQTALHGARFAVADPHAGAAEDSLAATLDPLRGIYLCDPAEEPRQILELARHIAHIGEQRVRGRDLDRTPIVFWLDELTGLLGRSDIGPELAEVLERIAQEYRKRHIYLSASGQIWTAARATSELRDSFASVVCHRMKRSQARLLLPTEEAATVERLGTGQAVLWRTSGATSVITVPNTTAADVRQVARLLTDDAPTMPRMAPHPAPQDYQRGANEQPERNPNGAAAVRLQTAPESSKTASPEATRAAALFLEGKSPAEIVMELRGVSTKSGSRYQAALEEILRLIREGVSAQAAPIA
jgi:hypothetical protein